MIRINLLPTKAARKKESVIQQLVVGVVVLVAAGAFCLWKNNQMDQRVDAESANIKDLEAKIAQLESIRAEVENFKKKKRDLNTKIDTIKDLNANRSGPVKMMEEFTYVLPRKAWISVFREVDKQLTLEGVAVDGPTVSDFVDNLRGSKFFYDVQLIQVSQFDEAGKKLQRFNVNCRVRYQSGEKA